MNRFSTFASMSLPGFVLVALVLNGCSGTSASNEEPANPKQDEEQSNERDNEAAREDDTNHSGESSDNADSTSQSNHDNSASHPSEPDGAEDKKPRPRIELFKDWPKPQFAILITGRQHGYVEPCGCTGLENQKGGLVRRHAVQKDLIARGWPLVSIDAGNQVRRFGPQPDIKFELTMDSLKHMDYAAVALGPDDLRVELTQHAYNDGDQHSLIVSANVAVFDRATTREFDIAEAGDKKIGITAILGTQACKKATGDLLTTESPEDGLKRVWPKLADAKCDFYVLISHAPEDESRELAKKFPQFDLVVSASGAGEPLLVEQIEGTNTTIVEVGTKSMFAGVVGVFDDAATPIRNQYVPLSDRFADSEDMLAKFKEYQQRLESTGLLGEFGLLGRSEPVLHPTGLTFVGSTACKDCHEEAYDIWKDGVDGGGGAHYHATKSLTHPGQRSDIPRHHDPECLSCHVTGWNPQDYYPYLSGYLKEANLLMHGNGCENCHGPGSRHVAAENGDLDVGDEELESLQRSMRLTLEEAKASKCYTCHDIDNSPDFHEEGAFEQYWSQIEH